MSWELHYEASKAYRPSTVQALSDFAARHQSVLYNPRHVPCLLGVVRFDAYPDVICIDTPDTDDTVKIWDGRQ